MSGRLFVMGDVHGAHRALVQVLERAGFDRESDRLIFLGDVADGWPETRECIDELLTVKHLVALIGNHDEWMQAWVDGEHPGWVWLAQGGQATVDSYGTRSGVPDSHRRYLRRAKLWHQEGNRIFVHAGWDWTLHRHPMAADPQEATWDRTLWKEAVRREVVAAVAEESAEPITEFAEVYVGHTTTTRAGFTEPVQRCEVWNLDQGAGWEGRLSLMDVDSKEFWQSDVVADLYPEHAGRRRAA